MQRVIARHVGTLRSLRHTCFSIFLFILHMNSDNNGPAIHPLSFFNKQAGKFQPFYKGNTQLSRPDTASFFLVEKDKRAKTFSRLLSKGLVLFRPQTTTKPQR